MFPMMDAHTCKLNLKFFDELELQSFGDKFLTTPGETVVSSHSELHYSCRQSDGGFADETAFSEFHFKALGENLRFWRF